MKYFGIFLSTVFVMYLLYGCLLEMEFGGAESRISLLLIVLSGILIACTAAVCDTIKKYGTPNPETRDHRRITVGSSGRLEEPEESTDPKQGSRDAPHKE